MLPDDEIIIVDENIEKEKLEAEALAAEKATLVEEATRQKEEEEIMARRRRARAWMATPPDTGIVNFPENPTLETTASFKFSSTKPNSIFHCSLDGADFAPCEENTNYEKTYENLLPGEHILKVQAEDEYENIDETPAEYEWTIKNPPHLVISEILFDAEDLDTGKEFIELYNPTNDLIDLNKWSLYYLKDGSSELKSLINFNDGKKDTIISKNGFFLVGFNNYSENNYLDDDYLDNNRDYIYADARRSASLLNGGVGDAVQKITIILLDNSGQEIDSMNYDKNSIVVAGQSLERKALQNGDCVSSQLKGEFLGNGCDTDDEGDFEIRLAPNPQNSDSVAEPRPTPVHIINGLDYPGIQWAIDKAVAGDEIQVDSGEYAEELIIDKGIILRGVDTGSGKPIIKEVANEFGNKNNITLTADGVTIDGFNITGSGQGNDGIYTETSNNTIINNTINVGSDGIYLYNSHNNKIIGNNLSNSGTGMYVDHSIGNIITDNVMSFNKSDGIVMFASKGNMLSNNIFKSNGNQGIEIIDADDNIINKNISSNNLYGIILRNSFHNIVTENTFSLNGNYGIESYWKSINEIYHNNITDNKYQAFNDSVEFFWDNDYPSGGNFWSDYIGVDINSGVNQDEPGIAVIGDVPYIIVDSSGKEIVRDRYPLTKEYKMP